MKVSMNSSKIVKKVAPFVITVGVIAGVGFIDSDKALGHGYVSEPASRAKLGAANNVGSVQYEPQSLEAPKGFPLAGPVDGKIASAGGMFGGILDQQSSDRWIKHDMVGGVNDITWYNTAPHRTAKWHYYITKKGWNSNAPIKRSDLELIGTFEYGGKQPERSVTHKVNVPTDRNGYHIILAVWDIEDTTNAFYQVIDVNLKNDGSGSEVQPDTEKPSTVAGLHTMNVEASSVDLSWNAATDNIGVDHYMIYRGDSVGIAKQIGTSSTTNYKDITVEPDKIYTYYIVAVDRAGNTSNSSNIIVVNTPAPPVVTPPVEIPDTEKPSVVEGIHTMSVKHNSVDLMWNASQDNVGVDHYVVYRDGIELTQTKGISFTDVTVQASTTYIYYVRAVDAAGNVSDKSSSFTVITLEKPVLPEVAAWNATGLYIVGTKVEYKGNLYEARVTFRSYGDTNWNPESALSLWKPVTNFL
jgi:chitin-binding protein